MLAPAGVCPVVIGTCIQVVAILLENGGDPNLVNDKDLSPMDICKDEAILKVMRGEMKMEAHAKLRGGRKGKRVGLVGGAGRGKAEETDQDVPEERKDDASPSSRGVSQDISLPLSPKSSPENVTAASVNTTISAMTTTTPSRKLTEPQAPDTTVTLEGSSGSILSPEGKRDTAETATKRPTRAEGAATSLSTSPPVSNTTGQECEALTPPLQPESQALEMESEQERTGWMEVEEEGTEGAKVEETASFKGPPEPLTAAGTGKPTTSEAGLGTPAQFSQLIPLIMH